MHIFTMEEYEKQRLAARNNERKPSWEYAKYTDYNAAAAKATELGWYDRKVQIRKVRGQYGEFEYFIEPYEYGCQCGGIMRAPRKHTRS
jgi:hypothetical protein